MLRKFGVLISLVACLGPTAGWGQAAGEVVAVVQSATIISGGSTSTIDEGSPVSSGDTIRTGASGQVQILFLDETKIVVGPNSTLRIDETLFRANGTARSFATSAIAGSFRFISGKSPKRVYKVATPVATMGIRGTAFDYTVTAGQSTDLLVFNGRVNFCAAGRRCASVPGGCQAVSVLQDGQFAQPLTVADKKELLARRFPLLEDQAELQTPFRVGTAGCGSAKAIPLPGIARSGESDRSRRGENPADGPSDPGGDDGNPAN